MMMMMMLLFLSDEVDDDTKMTTRLDFSVKGGILWKQSLLEEKLMNDTLILKCLNQFEMKWKIIDFGRRQGMKHKPSDSCKQNSSTSRFNVVNSLDDEGSLLWFFFSRQT